MVLVFLSSQACFCRRSCSRCRKKSSSVENFVPRTPRCINASFVEGTTLIRLEPNAVHASQPKQTTRTSLRYTPEQRFSGTICPFAFFLSDKPSDGGLEHFPGQTDKQGGIGMRFLAVFCFPNILKTSKT